MANIHGIDPQTLYAWLSARSVARGLPLPVPEHGGFRVDTNSDAEVARWVFPAVVAGLGDLARSISKPRHVLKLCGTCDELRAWLPIGWTIHAPRYFMQGAGKPPFRHLPCGYTIKISRVDMVLEARIFFETGALAASGYAVETGDICIYDRIVTEPDHRRKGLGHALMRALHDARRHVGGMELLVATQDGQALYSTLGWETISPYSTASIVEP